MLGASASFHAHEGVRVAFCVVVFVFNVIDALRGSRAVIVGRALSAVVREFVFSGCVAEITEVSLNAVFPVHALVSLAGTSVLVVAEVVGFAFIIRVRNLLVHVFVHVVEWSARGAFTVGLETTTIILIDFYQLWLKSCKDFCFVSVHVAEVVESRAVIVDGVAVIYWVSSFTFLALSVCRVADSSSSLSIYLRATSSHVSS